jgi:hypothetical protein
LYQFEEEDGGLELAALLLVSGAISRTLIETKSEEHPLALLAIGTRLFGHPMTCERKLRETRLRKQGAENRNIEMSHEVFLSNLEALAYLSS